VAPSLVSPCAGRRELGTWQQRFPEGYSISFLLSCPNCGPRDVNEFAYAGEVSVRPRPEEQSGIPPLEDLAAYVYLRRNVAGIQREWWFHRLGCESWFQAERDTRTNEVLTTAFVERSGQAPPAPEAAATPDTPAV